VTIIVAGRPVAVLGPITPRTWRQWGDVADLFRESMDASQGS
jgi:antitoxin (DNA-binding transcriptional repressor) of toxin-antitoxin stability system